jgi:hypothetical protein
LRDTGQALFDRFCQDMDHNLRDNGRRRSLCAERDAAYGRGVLRSDACLPSRAGGTGWNR